ncbi:hypothetical protein STEG23_019594 [Scotinomys teguina]
MCRNRQTSSEGLAYDSTGEEKHLSQKPEGPSSAPASHVWVRYLGQISIVNVGGNFAASDVLTPQRFHTLSNNWVCRHIAATFDI